VAFELLSRFRKRSADDPPPTESWPLFAFGKLPVYKDFISAGLTDDASREFRDWLSNGFSRLWSSRDDYKTVEIPLHAFLLRLPESRKVAVGALWGSRDQGGLRKFPFALFSILPAGKAPAGVLTALDYLPVFEARAREIRRKYDEGGSLAAVYQELRGAKIDVPLRTPDQIRARLAEALSMFAVGPLAKALFGEDAPARWPVLLAGLAAAAQRPDAGAGAFRFPLAEHPPSLHQLQLWTIRLTKASADGAGPSGVLYRTGGEVPCGVVFFRDVRAEDIFLFHPAAAPTDFVEEIPPPLRRSGPEEVAASPTAADEPAGVEAPPPVETAPPPADLPPAEQTPPMAEAAPAEASASPPETAPAEIPAAVPPVTTAPPAHPQTMAAPETVAASPDPPAAERPEEPDPAGWDLPLSSLLGGN
jgi:type VI secretion system ImpM family protein